MLGRSTSTTRRRKLPRYRHRKHRQRLNGCKSSAQGRKAYREKRKAERLAANGGEFVKKQVCPNAARYLYQPAVTKPFVQRAAATKHGRIRSKLNAKPSAGSIITASAFALCAAGFVLNLLYGICGSIGMILAGLGGFAAFLALLDGSYAQAAVALALLLCPFAVPMLLSLAGSALIVASSAIFAWLF